MWSGQSLPDRRLRLGRRFDARVLAAGLASRAGILVAHMMDALEASRNVVDLPALLLADLLALGAAVLAPADPQQFFFRFGLRGNIIRVDRLVIERVGRS